MTRKQSINIAKIYLDRLKEAGIPVIDAYMFGSQVKGNDCLYSDIDTCIVSSVFGKNRQQERVKLMNLRDDATLSVEPHPFSVEELNNSLDPLIVEIKKTGIRIFE